MTPVSEYVPIPAVAAKEIADRYQKSIVIIFAHDPVHGLVHTTTYGVREQDKEWAAIGGEIATRALGGMPEAGTCFEDYRIVRMRRAEQALKDIIGLPQDEEIREAQHIAKEALTRVGEIKL